MKRNILILLLIFFIVLCIVFIGVKQKQKLEQESQKFNTWYERYNKEGLNGLDITTVINKAINNNEKNNVEKNENGEYIENDTNSVKIYIKMIINNKVYSMEKINTVGIESFIEYFGAVDFKCTEVKYHNKTKKISEMTFEAMEY